VAGPVKAIAGGGTAAQARGDAGEQTDAGGLIGPSQQVGRAQGRGRDVVVGFAVGQGEGVQALGVAGGKYLGDGAARVVGDQIDLVQTKGVAAIGDEAGQAGQREVLAGRGRGLAVEW